MGIGLERIALYMQDKHPIEDEIRYAKLAEELGYEAVWFAESRLARDAIVPMAAVAAVTDGIKIGSGVVNNWTRNVGLMAATFSTLYELAPGRVLLGIGAWWDPLAAKVGIRRNKPLKAMREYVTVLRRLFDMEEVTFHGEFIQVDGIRLDVVYGEQRSRDIPIYIGATGFKMLELAGGIADGVLLNYLVSPRYNEIAMKHLEEGARRAGRELEQIDRPQLIVCSMDYDEDKALDNAKTLVAMYIAQQPHIMVASGVDEGLLEEVRRIIHGWPATIDEVRRAKEVIPDDVVKLLTATGTPEECRKRIMGYLEKGATCPVVYPLGEDVELMLRELSEGLAR